MDLLSARVNRAFKPFVGSGMFDLEPTANPPPRGRGAFGRRREHPMALPPLQGHRYPAETSEISWLVRTETKNGVTMTKRALIALFFASLLSMVATACHTVHGAGEDISTAGNKIQENTPP